MRKTCIETVGDLAEHDSRVFFIGSDLGVDIVHQFEGRFPGRFFMEGISESNLIGVAAGLAMEGKIVYLNTIATFLTRRCFEQVALDLCLHNVPVRLLGNGGGLVYSVLGPTHTAIEDFAIMRALPNMTIIAPADPGEMRLAMWATLDHPGPVYVRIARGGERQVTATGAPFVIGKTVPMLEGRDALLLSTGVTLSVCLEAAAKLRHSGLDVGVLHVPTIKPLDEEAILHAIGKVSTILTVEEHRVAGGLGSAVAELIAEAGFSSPKKLRRLGIPDIFPSIYATQQQVMERLGISVARIFELLEPEPRTSRKSAEV